MPASYCCQKPILPWVTLPPITHCPEELLATGSIGSHFVLESIPDCGARPNIVTEPQQDKPHNPSSINSWGPFMSAYCVRYQSFHVKRQGGKSNNNKKGIIHKPQNLYSKLERERRTSPSFFIQPHIFQTDKN